MILKVKDVLLLKLYFIKDKKKKTRKGDFHVQITALLVVPKIATVRIIRVLVRVFSKKKHRNNTPLFA